MKKILILMTLSYLAFSGCTGGKALVFKKDSACKTAIEGNFVDDYLWEGDAPAIITRDFNGYLTKYGKLMEIKEDGVVFDVEKQGVLSNPDPKYYPYKDLVCVIDDTGSVIHGNLPEKYKVTWELKLELVNDRDPAAKKVIVNLKQGNKFAYCIKPGRYSVQKITFKNNRHFEDVSRRVPNLSINVVENHINYIGDIRFDYTFENDSNTCAIPYKVVERPSDAMVGFAFGAVGALITEAKRSMAPDEYHTLTIKEPSELKTKTGSSLPVVNSPLSFKHRPKGQNGPEFETIKVNKSM